jgi:hypothetical protein
MKQRVCSLLDHIHEISSASAAAPPPSREDTTALQASVKDCRDQIEQSMQNMSESVDRIVQAKKNKGSNYYWIVFVVIYAAMFAYE